MQKRVAYRKRIGVTAGLLEARQQESGDARYDRRGKARSRAQRHLRLWGGAFDIVTRRQNAVFGIGVAEVAEVERPAGRVAGADGEDGIKRGGNLQAAATVIAGGGDDQRPRLGGAARRVGEDMLGLPGRRQLAAADVDDIRTVGDRLVDGERQRCLRRRLQLAIRAFAVDRIDDRRAIRRDPRNRAAALPDDHARHMGAVLGANGRNQIAACAVGRHPRSAERWMREVDRSVDDRDADARIATGHAVLQRLNAGDFGDRIHLALLWIRAAAAMRLMVRVSRAKRVVADMLATTHEGFKD